MNWNLAYNGIEYFLSSIVMSSQLSENAWKNIKELQCLDTIPHLNIPNTLRVNVIIFLNNKVLKHKLHTYLSKLILKKTAPCFYICLCPKVWI